jgi:predicted transcriptional regulator
VDDVMEVVLEKKGKVKIVENGKLSKYDGIVMILRYW